MAMRVELICLGRCKLSFVQEGVQEFAKRLKPYLKLEIKEINAEKFSNLPEAESKKREGKLFLEQLKSSDRVFLLDQNGKKFNSPSFSKLLARETSSNAQRLVFGIGGVNGWDQGVLSRADELIALSELTFTAQLARLVLVEQIYRAITIIKGLPYHR